MEIWTSLLAVQKQTRILETNVFTREDLTWEISILKQKRAPEKPLRIPSNAPRKPLKNDNGDGEGDLDESANSGSDPEDSLDDFVVSDEELPNPSEELEQNLAESEDDRLENVNISSASVHDSFSPEPSKPNEINAVQEGSMNDSASIAGTSIRHIDKGQVATTGLSGSAITTSKPPHHNSNNVSEVIDLTMISSDDAPQSSAQSLTHLVTPSKKNSVAESTTHNDDQDDEEEEPRTARRRRQSVNIT